MAISLTDLTSNARWRVLKFWDRGVPTVLARRSGRGFALRTFYRYDHYDHLLAEGWQVVEEDNMQRQQFQFRSVHTWSDHPDGGDSFDGAIPVLAVTPSGVKIDLDAGPQVARLERGGSNPWVALDGGVSVKEEFWGDDPKHSLGHSGHTMEVLAPEGTQFFYQNVCSYCGEPLNELLPESDLHHSNYPEQYHPACLKEQDEWDAFMEEEHKRYEQYAEDEGF